MPTWSDLRRNFIDEFNVDLLANPDVLDKVIIWRSQSPRVLRRRKLSAITRGEHMQRQFTVELRVDYADNDKNEIMRKALQHAARHVYATAVLLSDGVTPQVAVFSDDFFSGHEEIKLMDDVIQNGLEVTDMAGTEETVSSELMSAMRETG